MCSGAIHTLGYLYSAVLPSPTFTNTASAGPSYLICSMLTDIDLSVPLQIHTTCAFGLNLTVQLARSGFNYQEVNSAALRGVCGLGVCKQIGVSFRDKPALLMCV